ncbi:hypothetical protein ATANTOWER_003992, partial [Ataeniobius toweri]|nr:hypothetical protein [Ataeniobius toweri]
RFSQTKSHKVFHSNQNIQSKTLKWNNTKVATLGQLRLECLSKQIGFKELFEHIYRVQRAQLEIKFIPESRSSSFQRTVTSCFKNFRGTINRFCPFDLRLRVEL